MEPITWGLLLVKLITEVGLPAAQTIVAKWRSGAVATDADFEELKAMGKRSPEVLFDEVVATSGLDKNDPRVVELQNLIKARTPAPAPPAAPTPPTP